MENNIKGYQSENIIELFELIYNEVSYYFTNNPTSIESLDGSITYLPLHITRSSTIVRDLKLTAKNFSVACEPVDFIKEINTLGGELMIRYSWAYMGESQIKTQVVDGDFKEYYGNAKLNSEPKVLYIGSLRSLSFDGSTGIFSLEFVDNILLALKKRVLQYAIQPTCNCQLYGSDCGLA